MKKLLSLNAVLFVLVLSFTLYSCEKDNGGNNIIIDNPVGSDAEAFALVNGAYGPYQTLSSTFTSLIDTPTDGTFSYLGDEDGDAPLASRLEIEYTNLYPRKTFNALYKSIGIVNDAIFRISNSPAVTESGKKLAVARARFLRGLFYSYLVQLWGEVPLILEPDDSDKERVSIDNVYTQIVKDLTEAEADLPDYDPSPVVPSKGAANALLARVYLAWGNKPLTQAQVQAIAGTKNDPSVSYDNARLNKAIEYADKVINSGNYSLLNDFKKLWGRANESKGPEQIFTIRHDGDGIDAQGNHQAHCAYSYPFEPEKEAHIMPSHVFAEWNNADPRKEFSITTRLVNPQNNSECEFLPPVTLPRYGKGIDRSYFNAENLTILTNDVDRIEIRYAEVLLTKAEALVELGRNAEALPLVNQIRERAYGNASGNLTTLTFQDVKDEWEYELVYEQHRWLNLVRWKELIGTVRTSVQGYEHFDESYATVGGTGRDGSTVNAFFARVHRHLRAKYNHIEGRNYRFPIPQGANFEDLGITPQNPGY